MLSEVLKTTPVNKKLKDPHHNVNSKINYYSNNNHNIDDDNISNDDDDDDDDDDNSNNHEDESHNIGIDDNDYDGGVTKKFNNKNNDSAYASSSSSSSSNKFNKISQSTVKPLTMISNSRKSLHHTTNVSDPKFKYNTRNIVPTKNYKITHKSLNSRRYNPIVNSNQLSDNTKDSHINNNLILNKHNETNTPVNATISCENNNANQKSEESQIGTRPSTSSASSSSATSTQGITTQYVVNEFDVTRTEDSRIDEPNDLANNHCNIDNIDNFNTNINNRRQTHKTTRQILNRSKQLLRKTKKPLLSMASGFGLYMITSAYSGIIKSYIPISPQVVSALMFTAVEAISKSIC
ncbi:putative protein 2 [Mauternbach virus]|uniref:Uncharacterized protein n=1 Tax=Mauternbach virus TaxID=2486603 RepID=A0A3G3E7L9_9VIRU|nr:putative protein 2 [Mauternbach virus]AYP97935.1 putative protein 2 [Mauternbach virus]